MTNLSNEMIEMIKTNGTVDTDENRYVLSFDYILDPQPVGYTIKRWSMADMESFWGGDIDRDTLEMRAEILLTCKDENEACRLWHSIK